MAGISFSKADERKWASIIKMLEADMKPRVKGWSELKERLGVGFQVRGTPRGRRMRMVYISRFYKILREVIATTVYQYPHLFFKAEHDPADPLAGDDMAKTTEIVEDLGNDALQLMRTQAKMRQAVFDALFCYRGYLKLGVMPPEGSLQPSYIATDAIPPNFPYVSRIPAEFMMVDPLCPPEDFDAAGYVVEKMRVSVDDLIADTLRFTDGTVMDKLRGLRAQPGGAGAATSMLTPEDDRTHTDQEKETLEEAHKIGNTRWMYEVHSRLDKARYTFVDGIKEPIEAIDHPMVISTAESFPTAPDPFTGEILLQRPPEEANLEAGGGAGINDNKRFVIDSGYQYRSIVLDTSENYYGTAVMEYENPIQDALIRSVSTRMEILEKFKVIAKMAKKEYDQNANLKRNLKDLDHGEIISLEDPSSLMGHDWGQVPSDQIRVERDLLAYEEDMIRASSTTDSDTATEAAINATAGQQNAALNQQPVEDAYIWIGRNTLNILADPILGSAVNYDAMTTKFGQDSIRGALGAWRQRGRVNINVAAGSMNVLYEQLHRDRTERMVAALRESPNIDHLELDRYILRASGETAPDKVLKADANIDAAKSAELENALILLQVVDPGVTPGEDHSTHIRLQNPDSLSQYPQFADQAPERQQLILQIAEKHEAAHHDAMAEESGRLDGVVAGAPDEGPSDIIGQVQSNAQTTQDVVSKEAEEAAKPGATG